MCKENVRLSDGDFTIKSGFDWSATDQVPSYALLDTSRLTFELRWDRRQSARHGGVDDMPLLVHGLASNDW